MEQHFWLKEHFKSKKYLLFCVVTWCWGPPCSPHCRSATRAGQGYCSWREHSVPTAGEERPDWAAAGEERPDWATAESRRQPMDSRRGMVRPRAGREEDPRLRHQGTQLLVKYIDAKKSKMSQGRNTIYFKFYGASGRFYDITLDRVNSQWGNQLQCHTLWVPIQHSPSNFH